VVNAWADAVSTCDVAALERLAAPALREGVVGRTRAVHQQFGEIAITLLEVVVDDDAAAWRWRLAGKHVSGERKTIEGVNFQRIREGVVVEHWTTLAS
jgi:hypothetical protein